MMLTRIMDGSPVPTFAIDKDHKVSHWNTALESLSGVERSDVIGTDRQWVAFYFERRPVMADLIVEGASDTEIEAYYGDRAKKSDLIEGAYEAEDFYPDLGEDGRWLNFTASPIRGDDGRVVGAVETMRDITEQKRLEANTRFYTQQVTKAQEEERKRIARELHDDLAQILLLLTQGLDHLTASKRKRLSNTMLRKRLEELRSQAIEALEHLRMCARDLRPPILDHLGLAAALDWLAEEMGKQGIEVKTVVKGDERSLPPEVELLLFRIAQEAMTNTRKHAEASRAAISLGFTDDKVVLEVKDNGKGFHLPRMMGDFASAGKLGLAGMEERAMLIGAELRLSSELGKGATVSVEAPMVCDIA